MLPFGPKIEDYLGVFRVFEQTFLVLLVHTQANLFHYTIHPISQIPLGCHCCLPRVD